MTEIVETLQKLKVVVHDCLGMISGTIFDESINQLQSSYIKLGISANTKNLCNNHPVAEFCKRRNRTVGRPCS